MSRANPSRAKLISIESFNEILEDTEYLNPIIKVNIGSVELIVNEITYKTSLTGNNKDYIDCGNIMQQLKKHCPEEYLELNNKEQFGYTKTYNKILNKTVINWSLRDPGNFSFIDENKRKKKLKCWSYDLNSAYSFAMLRDMPDTSKEPKINGLVGKNEIGFYSSGGATVEEGAFAEYIFPLIKSPFESYVKNYYEKKANAVDQFERFKWKNFLNIATGLLKRHNIFLRLAVLYYAAAYIASFIDENTVYCNTDSIVSTKPRTDLPIGTEIGQFKEERVNQDFKYLDVGIYQWGNECHYKGIPGCTLTDIEKTDDWTNNFPYKFDQEQRRIIKNEQKKK